MLKSKNKVIAISMGDPEGIGPEVIAKALKRISQLTASVIIVGEDSVIRRWLPKFPKNVSLLNISYKSPGEGSLKFLDKAIFLIKQGVADALVTGPLSKERVAQYSKGFIGHTEYLAQAFDVQQVEMMFVAGKIKTVIVTRHDSIKDLPRLITTSKVLNSIELTHQGLIKTFKIRKPRIAVLGLNPHAGENGLIGQEEINAIIPAIKKANQLGFNVKGPFPADTFFGHGLKDYDAVIAMYHDQGLIPIKTLYFKEVVNTTIGLPFVRTCPAHGTAFDIAGKGVADPSSMIASIKLAEQLI